MKRIQFRRPNGEFKRNELSDLGLGAPVCPKCNSFNPYQLHSLAEENGFINPKRNDPPKNCRHCGASLQPQEAL